ncbi:MAG: response regulator [Acidobacteria bacterium]|nr:response regulator [Acidobacteriota bacterium]
MNDRELQTFLEEAEIILHGIRGGILLFAQAPQNLSSLDVPARRINELRHRSEPLGRSEVADACAKVSGNLSMLHSAAREGRDVQSAIRGTLDAVADVELAFAGIRLAVDGPEPDFDFLVDTTFSPNAPVEAPPLPSYQPPTVPVMPAPAAQAAPAESDFSQFEIDAELLEVFAEEAADLLGNISASLDELQTNPDNKDALWEIRRNAHTFKGSAGIVGLKPLSEFAHRIEDLLDKLAESGGKPRSGLIPLLIESNTCLQALISGERREETAALSLKLSADFDAMMAAIENNEPDVLEVVAPAIVPELRQPAELPAHKLSQPVPVYAAQPEAEVPNRNRSIVRVSLDKLDELVGIVRDMVINRSAVEQRLSELDRQIDDLQNATRRLQAMNGKLEVDFEASMLGNGLTSRVSADRSAIHARSVHGDFDELEYDRYTEFHQAIRELGETSNDTFSINTALEQLKGDLDVLFESQRRLIDSVQERVMRIRLVEFGALRTRLERAVRVTCDEEGKRAEITLENPHLEIDTKILDSLIEPMLHLLKNAVVHGIEFPELRRLLGKPEAGRITVKLSLDETHVVLTVADDGGGISTGSLKEKAVIDGLISREQAERMSDEEAQMLIFRPGLTTSQKLNLNAGRGVGMSIVKESVESKKGTISMRSTPHAGTVFTIRMLLPLAVTEALIVTSGQDVFAVPLNAIRHIVEIGKDSGYTAEGEGYIDHAGERFRPYSLAHLTGLPSREALAKSANALLIECGDEFFAVAVDSVVRTEELVVKPLGRPLDQMPGVLGVSTLASGDAITILDLDHLLRDRPAGNEPIAEPPPVEKQLAVLIVDDSPSVRLLTSKVVKNAGWLALTAKDGIDALETLREAEDLPSIILSDIEMPRMGGYDLVAALKADERLREIPVIVITSRAGEKHRAKAEEQGVSDYLVKPYSEWELIQKIQALATPI